MNFSDVIKSASVENTLVGYQGALNEPTGYDFTRTQLVPFQGYFVNNNSASPATLVIPPQSATGTALLARQDPPVPGIRLTQSNEWIAQITAQADRFLDKDNYIGVLNGASDGWDRHDFSEAPFFDSYISLYFPHEDWQTFSSRYTGDFRSINSEGHFWDFRVKSNIPHSEVILILANIQNLPSGMDVVLIDKASRVSVNWFEQHTHKFPAGEGGVERDFRIVVGQPDFVDRNDLGFSGVPEQFALSQNYPNPFNPETRIDYELPSASDVTIAVYNLRGQQVRHLFSGKQSAGRYTVSWDGKSGSGLSVASGVYLIRMKASKFVSVRKILLAR